MEKGELGPLAGEVVLVQVSQLTGALLGRDVVHLVGLHFAHRGTDLEPSAVGLVLLSRSMPAAAPRTVMLDFDVILGLLESHPYFFAPENVAIEVFAEDLCCLIVNFVLRVDHDAVLGSCLIEDATDDLRVAAVDKYQLRHDFSTILKNLFDFVCCDRGQGSDVKLGIVLELEFSVLGAVTDYVKNLWFFVTDEMFEMLLCSNFALQSDLGFVRVLD